jgi:plasmid stability protein
MKNLLVRDVPDEVHAELQRRAERAGQSLQQYVAGELRRLTERPTLDDLLARIETHSGGRVGLDTAVADLQADRER